MLVTITQFRELARDANGNVLLTAGHGRTVCEARTTAGAFAALGEGTRFIRIATDTAVQMDIAGGATTSADELFPAGTVELVAVQGGETLTIATIV